MRFFGISSALLITACLGIGAIGRMSAQTPSAEAPSEGFKLSVSDRLRLETYDNTVTLSKAAKAGSSYARNRINILGQWFAGGSVEFGAAITNEFRNYFSPSTNDFYMNEIYFDQLYVKWKTHGVADGELTVGRQNITLGEGFLVLEGTPLDGSRSVYFNAARYDWKISPSHTLTGFYTYQPKIDKLPVINGRDIDPAFQGDGSWKLAEQTEAGGGLYYTGKLDGVNLQSYFIRKDYLEPDISAGQTASGLNTVGGRINTLLNKNFSATAEGAYQFGSSAGIGKKAFGGYCYVDYTPQAGTKLLPQKLTIGSVYLSGDDRSTKSDEGWDPIFSRWPKWSDSYVYTQIKEFGGRPAYWSNLASLYASASFTVDEQIGISAAYHHLIAPQSSAQTAYLSGSGNVRGDLMIAKLLFTMSKSVSGHVIIEHFIPGNYYFSTANVSNWGRIEFLFRI